MALQYIGIEPTCNSDAMLCQLCYGVVADRKVVNSSELQQFRSLSESSLTKPRLYPIPNPSLQTCRDVCFPVWTNKNFARNHASRWTANWPEKQHDIQRHSSYTYHHLPSILSIKQQMHQWQQIAIT